MTVNPLVTMAEEDREDYINLGSIFRSSATITFVIQIIAVILMFASVVAFALGSYFFALEARIQTLVLLVAASIGLVICLGAVNVFVRFSRRIGDAVVGAGIEEVKMNTPRVKGVVVLYGLLVAMMGITGIYSWYLVDSIYLAPWAASLDSESMRLFGLALGAFFIALLVQLIIAGVGRSATKVIIEVLDGDDSEFID